MPENTTPQGAPANEAPPQAPTTFSVGGAQMNTTENIMGATPIENQSGAKSSVAVWIGFGLILVAMIIAGTYYYMTTVEPDVTDEIPVVNIPVETDEERAIRDLDGISAELEASLDFSSIDAELDEITSDLDTIQ
ncbi:hypothetical protein A3C87_00450 [Candidatus Kaiserbacteria bacterium RIFCSPHIGHO2_02_FULL_49_34]|uniref:Uncharacterized protein n=1 Tax=Candidatus Kaiserbacteria bacterium RIFCSPHIGHO2_02_FULL_49_34 TaxID=1798491 RepID=A0A1F6DKB0_9BACT|nr:MAG: hypothetical protein A3C87_00450 [Candidatus Kaiserbacteria bacterium RIFCSPHIGHO2_02_FULL_49_34]